MKKKLLATAIAGAMVVPSAFAAQDNAGMHYTSASEGFYASIRLEYNSAGDDNDGANISQSWGPSRFGVQGTNDLGGGLEGYYRYETRVSVDNGGALDTRLAYVGLRGGFGQVHVGSFWAQNYNWLTGSTDVANTGAGNFQTYGNGIGLWPGRVSRAIEYTTPDLNGFQASAQVIMNGGVDGEGEVGATALTYQTVDGTGDPTGAGTLPAVVDAGRFINVGGTTYYDTDNSNTVTNGDLLITEQNINPKDDNDIDAYILNARYGVAGFDVAASYSVVPDGLGVGAKDHTGYAVKVGYAQDNWYVNGWYGKDNSGDIFIDDIEIFSIAGGVEVGKVNAYAMHENLGQEKDEDSYTVFGVQYNLGSRSRVWIDYVGRDLDSNSNADDYVAIGMRHDF